jgi:lipopolysaccharide export system protein LptA
LKIIITFLVIFSLNSFGYTAINISNSDLFIESEKIEILKEENEIHFLDNLKIQNEHIAISAKTAIYNKKNKMLSISGDMAKIVSSSSENPFSGYAKKIIVFEDNTIELIGNAYFENDGIKFKSSSIKFNQQDGKILN